LKTISKGLILALVIQFALVLPFVNIIGVKKAKAVVEPEVTMSQPMYTSQAKDKINFNLTINGEVHQIGATKDSSVTSLPVTKYDPNASGTYAFTTFNLPSGFVAFNLDGFSTPKLYLIVSNDELVNVALYQENLPQAVVPSRKSLVVLTTPYDVTYWITIYQATQNPGRGNSKYWQTMIWYADSSHVPRPVSTRLLSSEVPAVCQRTERNWDNLKKELRDLFQPAPGSVNGQSQNHNWEVTTGVTAEIFGAGYSDVMSAIKAWVIRQGFNLVNIDGVNVQGVIHAVETETLKPTSDGYQTLDNIVQYGYLLDQDLQMLIDNNANCGSHGVKFKLFKWNESLESDDNIFTSLPSIKEYVQEIVDVAKEWFERLSSPVVTAGELTEDVCGNGVGGLMSGKIFQWLFCELANIIHGIAASIMTRATEWLTASIGVDINIKFKDPEKDEVPTGGGGADTPTPGTGTPTPAPRTAAPMNISGTINFLNRSEFDRAKNGGMSVKVKNGQASGPEINVTNEMQWGNWNESEGKGSVSCRFTTTENIPADWTVVTIFGKRGDTVVMRIMTQYPPDPAAFVISNTFAN